MKPYYERDGIVLLHADCLDVLPTLEAVDCTVTSPPYNQIGVLPVEGSGMWGQSSGGAGFLRSWQETGYADSMDEYEYQEWQRDTFTAVAAATAPTGSLFYNHQVRWRDGKCLNPLNWFYPMDWHLRQEIIWDRGDRVILTLTWRRTQ